ncbi:MAG: glycosyltransferase family 39 protein [Planctomycetes bacterium]|nr:glycosyltransferase family 39 protein [Planctomycetota bacterium]
MLAWATLDASLPQQRGRAALVEYAASPLALVLVLAVVTATRLVIAWSSQNHVHSDEAIIGLMAKHISDGRVWPLYMYGQTYASAASWEAYCAAPVFALFGPGVLQLKSCVVLLSSASLAAAWLVARRMFGGATALGALVLLATTPALARWPYQVTGYSFFFLGLPIVLWSALRVADATRRPARAAFVFGACSGLAVWGLELAFPVCAVLALLLVLRGSLRGRGLVAGVAGALLGYAPAIAFNLTHDFANWRAVFGEKLRPGRSEHSFGASLPLDVLARELPRGFGTDTTLWFVEHASWIGWTAYVLCASVVVIALVPLARRPLETLRAWRSEARIGERQCELVLLACTAACFAVYLAPSERVPTYLLGAMVFLALLAAHVIGRSWRSGRVAGRIAAATLGLGFALTHLAAQVHVASSDHVDTLLFSGEKAHMGQLPAADIEAVQRTLTERGIRSVWTTPSFVYPLIFESDETLGVSGSWIGWTVNVYPSSIPAPVPRSDELQAFVVEADSPYRPRARQLCRDISGRPPSVVLCGQLVVLIEDRGALAAPR